MGCSTEAAVPGKSSSIIITATSAANRKVCFGVARILFHLLVAPNSPVAENMRAKVKHVRNDDQGIEQVTRCERRERPRVQLGELAVPEPALRATHPGGCGTMPRAPRPQFASVVG